MSPSSLLDAEVFTRHCVDFISESELTPRLAPCKPLRIKFGMDPSSPDLHVGHMVQLMKLRDLQLAGHQIVMIVGDATAMVGDPSGRNKLRPQLTRAQVEENLITYTTQAGCVLDLERTEVRRNSEWFDKMDFQELLRLTARMTVARMLERDTFQKRVAANEAIGIHEFLYPLMQGWDSVMVAADVELGGTDQLFNLLVGRQLQEQENQKPQLVMTLPLICGTDGRKMSKSYGNSVGLTDDPRDMFGKLMSLRDEEMAQWMQLLLRISDQERAALLAGHPRQAKAALAHGITAFLHGSAAADEGREAFDSQFRDGNLPDDIPEFAWPSDEAYLPLMVVLAQVGLAATSSEARRLIGQGAVRIDGEVCNDVKARLQAAESSVLVQVGKRRFGRVAARLMA